MKKFLFTVCFVSGFGIMSFAEEPNCTVVNPDLGTVGSEGYQRVVGSETTTTYNYEDSYTENSSSWNVGGEGSVGTNTSAGINGGYNSGSDSETYSSGYSVSTTERTECFGADKINND